MKAVLIDSASPNFALRWDECATPTVREYEVLIDIRATALNRADLLQRAGKYPPPPGESSILGLEAAGVISAVGSKVKDRRIGERVATLLSGGGYAQLVAAPAALLLPIPDNWSFEYAAAIPEAFYTAFLNLFIEGTLTAGERLLIHAGASGVGTAAIQLAREFGVKIAVTAGTSEKLDLCRSLGAEIAINYKSEDFVAGVKSWGSGEGVDVIFDMVGATYLSRNLEVLAPKGRLLLISSTTGSPKAELNVIPVIRNRLRIIGSVLRSRSREEKITIHERFIREVWPLLLSGKMKPIIDSTFPITRVEEAHERMRQNLNAGKIVLSV